MTWTIAENSLIGQPIGETSTTAKMRLGSRVRAKHATYGQAEFIYLKGVASTVVGSWATFNADDWSTALTVGSAKGPVAIAMSANVANQYGWYMVFGKHPAAQADDVADNADVYVDTATAGRMDDTVITGDRVHGAKWASADDTATTSAEVEIAYPFLDDGVGGGAT